MIQPSGSSPGLLQAVKEHLKATLISVVPRWQAEPAADLKVVRRQTGPGTFSTDLEPYRGTLTWINFRLNNAGSDEIASLEEEIRKVQPELLGYVIHEYGGQLIQDGFALCIALSQEVSRRMGSATAMEAAIASVISDLDKLLITGEAIGENVTYLSGLRLPDGPNQVELEDGLYIRNLTADEISEIGSSDILLSPIQKPPFGHVSACLVSRRPVKIRISATMEPHDLDWKSHQLQWEQTTNVLGALHILKSGHVAVLASFTKIHPSILPNLGQVRSLSVPVSPFGSMELTLADVDVLLRLHDALVKNQRDEVRIAAARLLDAEGRTSPVDALLDAVIGLEILLNPNDRSELAFRVAINYAFLGPVQERRKRYDIVRGVQETRNRVVHGGLNLLSKDAPLLYEHSPMAIACLRDALQLFLTDATLRGNQKLNADFWLDRILPPSTNN